MGHSIICVCENWVILPKVCTPSLFYPVSSALKPPYLFPLRVLTCSVRHPQAWRDWGVRKELGLSVVSFPVSTLEIGRFLGSFYFLPSSSSSSYYRSHLFCENLGIWNKLTVARVAQGLLHHVCHGLSTHYDVQSYEHSCGSGNPCQEEDNWLKQHGAQSRFLKLQEYEIYVIC